MTNVIDFDGYTKLDISIEKLRDNIPWKECDTALVITWQDGRLVAYSNIADMEHCAFLAQKFLFKCMNGDFGT